MTVQKAKPKVSTHGKQMTPLKSDNNKNWGGFSGNFWDEPQQNNNKKKQFNNGIF